MMGKFPILVAASSSLVFVAGGGYKLLPRDLIDPSCNIKGNISISSGERIYHVPGQKYYTSTIIRPEHGERWFCSEGDARSAGWRKSRS